ncbi:MAG: hypothetical protein KGZ65_06155 [Sphingomonadales bacterium]|nr:hypothetical protein [Sphingomonadaceae bacterium]MBS3930802.1 hypothetical protein [Sphingomonadales bacterium]
MSEKALSGDRIADELKRLSAVVDVAAKQPQAIDLAGVSRDLNNLAATIQSIREQTLEEVVEMVEAAAAKERELDLNAKGAEYATYHYTYQRLESLAAQLKEATNERPHPYARLLRRMENPRPTRSRSLPQVRRLHRRRRQVRGREL